MYSHDTYIKNTVEMNALQATVFRGKRGYDCHWILPLMAQLQISCIKKNQHPSIDSLSMNDFVSEVFWRQQMDFFPISYLYLLNGDLRDKEVFISF